MNGRGLLGEKEIRLRVDRPVDDMKERVLSVFEEIWPDHGVDELTRSDGHFGLFIYRNEEVIEMWAEGDLEVMADDNTVQVIWENYALTIVFDYDNEFARDTIQKLRVAILTDL